MITKTQIGPLSLLFDDVKWFFACKSFISHQRWQIARMIIKQFIISSWDMQFSRHLSIYLSWHPLIMARGKLEMAQKCNQCDFASEWADSLRKHSKIHNGDRSYKCNQCDYAYIQAVHLRTHLKSHSGDKSDKCNQCDYATVQASDLRSHLKTHTGE